MRCVYGNYRADSGRVLVRHGGAMVDIASAPPREVIDVRARSLGYVSQFLRVVPRVPCLDIVADGRDPDAARALLEQDRIVIVRGRVDQRGGVVAPDLPWTFTSQNQPERDVPASVR